MSFARFGVGSIFLLSILAGLSILLFLLKLDYFAIVMALTAVVIFAVKSLERIQVARPEERKLVGQTCLVIKQVTKAEKGIVKIFKDDGSLDYELWSAELHPTQIILKHIGIPENEIARVVGIRGITLVIEPLK